MASDVTFDIIARDRASNTFTKIGKSADGASRRMSSFGAIGKKAALTVAGGLTAAAAASGVLFKSSIDKASDLQETMSKSAVIFGKNNAEILKWSRGSAKAFGLSRQEAIESAASFGDMFSQIGFTGDAAAKMSKDVVKMSADFGSFNNLPTAEVTDMISAAFRGEYDSLQRVIPNINAARVEQEALAATGKKAAKQLTAQEKAAATLAILHKDGSRAAGDFRRTSGGLANQQKILAAQFDNVKAKLGSALIPLATKFVGFLSAKAVPKAKEFAEVFKVKVLPALADAANFIGTKVIPWFKKFGDEGSQQGRAFKKFGTFIRQTFTDIKSILSSASSIAQSFWAKYGDLITKYGINTLKNAVTVIRGAFTVISGLFKTVAAVMKGDWSGAWKGIQQTVRGAAGIVKGLVSQMWNQVKAIFSAGVRTLGSVASAAWGGVKDAFANGANRVIGVVTKLPGRIGAALAGVAGKIFAPFAAEWQKVIDLYNRAKNLGKEPGGRKGGNYKYTPPSARSSANGGTGISPRMVAGAQSAAKKYADALTQTIYKTVAKGTPKVQTALDRVRNLLDKFKSKLADLRGLRSEFTSTFSSDSIFGADMETTGTLSKLLEFQSMQASKAQQLLADVRTVTSKGLSKSLVAQLQASGSAGAEQLRLLAGANAQQIALFNSLNAQAQGANASAGLLAGNYVRGGNIDQDIANTKMAVAISTAVAKELGKSSLKGEVKVKGGDIIVSVRATNQARGRKPGDFSS